MKLSILYFFLAMFFNSNAQARFPESCVGNWEGKMFIYGQGMLRDSVDVALTVEVISDSTWKWKTEYFSTKYPVVKDYKLRYVEKNIYAMDEGDGIELLTYHFHNKLLSSFETEGIYLTVNYELINDNLVFEVTSGKKIPATNSVINYSIDNLQKVIFHRKK